MPDAKPLQFPKLHKHKTGQFFAKWGGQFHYYGADAVQAQDKYAEDMNRWREWKTASRAIRRVVPSKPVFVAQLVAKFLDYKELEGGRRRRSYYANHLRRFANVYGNVHGGLIRAAALQSLKEDMLRSGYDPKTINHDLSCVKSLFLWASGMDYVPAVNLRMAKPMVLAPTPDRSLTRMQVKEFMNAVDGRVKPWLAVQYLCLMRPSEVVKVVNRQGVWEKPWLFRLHHSKTDERSQEFRRIVFSASALVWLKKCEPFCSRQDAYWKAVSRCIGDLPYTPHVLRHTAATHLSEQKVDQRDIDLLLGHLPPRVTRTYVRIDWKSLQGKVARLKLPRGV